MNILKSYKNLHPMIYFPVVTKLQNHQSLFNNNFPKTSFIITCFIIFMLKTFILQLLFRNKRNVYFYCVWCFVVSQKNWSKHLLSGAVCQLVYHLSDVKNPKIISFLQSWEICGKIYISTADFSFFFKSNLSMDFIFSIELW